MALVGRYEIDRQLGKGTTGTVYRAKDFVLGRDVALKILNSDSRFSSRFLDLFFTDGQAASDWLHPNIAEIHDLGESPEGPFVAMELLTGVTMEHSIVDGRTFSLAQKLDFLIQACNGLAHAHRNGVVHAALTPRSFLIGENGQVKVLDLGIRHLGFADPNYLAPEQVSENLCDVRCDLFSTAVVFYCFLANAHPFAAQEVPATKLLTDLGLPVSLERLFHRALSKSPDDRPQSALEFAASLRAIELEMSSPLMHRFGDRPRSREGLGNARQLDELAPAVVVPDLPAGGSATPKLLRPRLLGVPRIRLQVVATVAVAVALFSAAFLANRLRVGRRTAIVARAKVNASETSLLEAPVASSRSLSILKSGSSVNILERVPVQNETFVHVQVPLGGRAFSSGYIRTADLNDWLSDNPETAWGLLSLGKPDENSSPGAIAQYLADLEFYGARFPSSKRTQSLGVEIKHWNQVLSRTALLQAGPPVSTVQANPEEGVPAPAVPSQNHQKAQQILARIPALWNDGSLEEILDLARQAITLDPENQQALAWRLKAGKALRKLNDQ